MILYFSGTGNSRFLAQCLAEKLPDEIIDTNVLLKAHKAPQFVSSVPYVFVCPTYAWRIPRIWEALLRDCDFTGSSKAYFVLNCGSEIGNAGLFLKKFCAAKGLDYMGVAEIVMPENYIAVFAAPDENTAAELTAKGAAAAAELVPYIRKQNCFPEHTVSLLDRIKSRPVNNLFYSFIVKDTKFYSTEKCTGCGQCAGLCPLNNIRLPQGKPVWGSKCTHCMACICRCPEEAIEYGRHTLKLRRYYCGD